MPIEETQVFRTNSQEEKAINEGSNARRKREQRKAGQTRELHDNQQTGTAGKTKHIEVEFGKKIEAEPETEASPAAEPETEASPAAEPETEANTEPEAVIAPQPQPKPKPRPVPEMDFIAKDAAPWALSINLEQRLKALGATTASVNKQIDELDAGVKNLKKVTGL